ncbi:MAG TPA: hypothetical protein ENI27_06755 [bacterium]|nr:hypothetical protein [bacterium]
MKISVCFVLLIIFAIGLCGYEIGRREVEEELRAAAVRTTISVIGYSMMAETDEDIIAIWTGFAEYADFSPEELNRIIEVWIDNPIKPPSRKDI